jgi:hypothetical protein
VREVNTISMMCTMGLHARTGNDGIVHGCAGRCRGNDSAGAVGNFAGESVLIICACECHREKEEEFPW